MMHSMRRVFYFIKALCLSALAVLALTFTAAAQTYTVLHSFSGGADGGSPFVGVTMDRAGNLYGTTLDGGSGYGLNGYGTVFELKHNAAEWVITPLYDFLGGTNDGAGPYSRVDYWARWQSLRHDFRRRRRFVYVLVLRLRDHFQPSASRKNLWKRNLPLDRDHPLSVYRTQRRGYTHRGPDFRWCWKSLWYDCCRRLAGLRYGLQADAFKWRVD